MWSTTAVAAAQLEAEQPAAAAEEPKAAAEQQTAEPFVPHYFVQEWSTGQWMAPRLLRMRLQQRREQQRSHGRARGCRGGRRGRNQAVSASASSKCSQQAGSASSLESTSREERQAECVAAVTLSSSVREADWSDRYGRTDDDDEFIWMV